MLKIIDCEQGSPEWKKHRCGLPTTSNFGTILAKGKSGGESITRKKLLYQLAGEILTGEPMESYSNGFMDRGNTMEGEARDYYSFLMDVEPEIVGFIRNGNKGASPDSLIGTDGLLEIKTKSPHILIELILKNEFPSEHRAQVQGQLWVSEREWCDVLCYFTGMPPFLKKVRRDEVYIRTMATAVDQFNEELIGVVERIKRYAPLSNEVANAA